MAVNKATITINSRQYTVVAEESAEYIERLGNHINEKVQNVLKGGQNILGERPVVLAALNICDEYFKALESDEYVNGEFKKLNDKIEKLEREKQALADKLEDTKRGQISIEENALNTELELTKNKLETANNKIKFLDENVKSLEKKLEEYKRNTVVSDGKKRF